MITTFYPPYNFGGDGMGVLRLAQALVRRGHDVTVVHDADAFTALGGRPAAHDPVPDGVRVVTLHSALGRFGLVLGHQLGRPVVHRRRLREALDAGQFDVINFNNVSLMGGPGVLAFGRGLKAYLAHEHWLVCPTHVLWRHQREPCTGRQCLRCTLRYRRPPQLWRHTGLLERSASHVDAFIAMSEFSRAKHAEFGFPRPMEVLPYFLPDKAAAGAAARPQERPYYLFVGRLEKIKGLDDVIPAFRDSEADLLIAGDGTYEPTLRALAADIPRVRFLGRVAPEALRPYYRHAEALVVPSVCYETFGIIIIEAFRDGVPVLARRIGPFPEIITRSGGGELFGDAAELRAAMTRLRQTPGRRDELARAARRGFEQYWCEDAVVPEYFRILHRAALRTGRTALAGQLATGAGS
jgi:glycosyltransferase involved in cell wall biosynthesis